MQRILVVDDERLIADTLRTIFCKRGFEVRTAYSASEGLEAARSFHPQLLLCDVSMPGEDGISLASKMAEEQPDCRILILTGYYYNLKTVRDRSQGFAMPWNILTKPVHPEELVRQATSMLAAN